jgi:hypothetical protein
MADTSKIQIRNGYVPKTSVEALEHILKEKYDAVMREREEKVRKTCERCGVAYAEEAIEQTKLKDLSFRLGLEAIEKQYAPYFAGLALAMKGVEELKNYRQDLENAMRGQAINADSVTATARDLVYLLITEIDKARKTASDATHALNDLQLAYQSDLKRATEQAKADAARQNTAPREVPLEDVVEIVPVQQASRDLPIDELTLEQLKSHNPEESVSFPITDKGKVPGTTLAEPLPSPEEGQQSNK